MKEKGRVAKDIVEETGPELTKEQQLYQIPEALQAKEDRIAEQADRQQWNTGLVEVPLGIEYI